MPAGRLFVVASPIGNLEDITLRAIEVLKSVPLIACEDTRRTEKLLHRLGIRAKKTSFHEHNEKVKTPLLIRHLKEGADLALLTDAGTPLVSDPGCMLIAKAVEEEIPVVPVPGVSAVTAALSVTPLRDGRFFFYGYLPSRQGERQRALAALRSFSGGSLVFFESPRRLEKALHDILEILGDRQIVMAREMTKIHEEFLRGSVREVLGAIRGKAVKGEVTLIIGSGEGSGSGAAGAEKLVREESIQEHFERIRIAGGLSDKEAMRQVARERGISRRDVYRALLEQKSDLHKQD